MNLTSEDILEVFPRPITAEELRKASESEEGNRDLILKMIDGLDTIMRLLERSDRPNRKRSH